MRNQRVLYRNRELVNGRRPLRKFGYPEIGAFNKKFSRAKGQHCYYSGRLKMITLGVFRSEKCVSVTLNWTLVIYRLIIFEFTPVLFYQIKNVFN